MKFKQLINPHSHTDGSLDGASTVTDIVKRNIELGAKYVAVTEHGNINTAMDMYHTCKKLGAKAIIGIELYLEPFFIDELRSQYKIKYPDDPEKIEKEIKKEYVHLTVHFKDEWAYQYFCNLTPKMNERAVVKGGEAKPICTLDELAGATGHIVICSSCLIGLVQRWLVPFKPTGLLFVNREAMAEKAYCLIREIAGKDNFFVEIFPHQLTKNWVRPTLSKETKQIVVPGKFVDFECSPWFPDGDWQKKCNEVVLNLAKKYGDKVIISLDSHFARPEDKLTQDCRLGNGAERWKFSNSYHVMQTEDAASVLKTTLGVDDRTIEEWVDNSWHFGSLFDDFKLTTFNDRWVLQPVPENWPAMIKQKIDKYGRMNWSDPTMCGRLKYELDVLARNGSFNFIPYIFTVENVSNFCKENGILMNVRGSAGGSLLLYLLGISGVNPLKHDLSFERFITIGRIKANTPPDVDMDISDKDKVIEFLEKEHGDAMCKLSIDSMLKLKSSIKDAERSLKGNVSKETEIMCKSLPYSQQGDNEREVVFGYKDEEGAHVPGLADTNPSLKHWIQRTPEVWSAVKSMLGVQRNKSVHACGVVIADKAVQEYCPVINVGGTRVTGFNPKSAELAGLIKFDFLGLNTLLDIEKCLTAIKEIKGLAIDPWDLPYDEKVMVQFCLGNTATVFQFDSAIAIPLLRKIKPTSIEDLAMITSVGRPGTLDAPYGDGRTLAEVFVARRQGEKIEYIHPDLEPIFKDTLGIQIYQEQTLRIFRDIAGYSYEEAETVRRGIGKKIESVLLSCMGDLKRACIAKGWTESQVDLLIEQIMASSDYSFNKSHAVSYAYVAYACMYLKVNYSKEWWLGCMSNANKDELVSDFWRHVKDFTVLPDINISKNNFYIKNDKLIAPISIINGIGPKAYEQMTLNMPYKDFNHFVDIHFSKRKKGERSAVNIGMVEKMIIAGVMDSFFSSEISLGDKLATFLALRAEVRRETLKEQLDESYFHITELGRYLTKKDLIKVYSDDLRPIMLPSRGGALSPVGFWRINGVPVFDHVQINNLKDLAANKKGATCEVGCIAYVIDESIINYKNKTKKATKMNVDVNGGFFEEVFWPAWGEDSAPAGFKGLPVLFVYKGTQDRFSLRKVIPLLKKEELGKYNII